MKFSENFEENLGEVIVKHEELSGKIQDHINLISKYWQIESLVQIW